MKGMSSFGFQIAEIAMKSPSTITRMPAKRVMASWFLRKVRPMPVAVAPRSTKTAVNPATNSSVTRSMRTVDTLPSDISAAE